MNEFYLTAYLGFVAIFIFTVLLLRVFAAKNTPYFVLVFTLLGWNLGFGFIAILPLDIYIVHLSFNQLMCVV